MENIVYNELRAREYQVDVGVVPIRRNNDTGSRERAQLEIDFVATLGSKKYYIQSAFSLPDEEMKWRKVRGQFWKREPFHRKILKQNWGYK